MPPLAHPAGGCFTPSWLLSEQAHPMWSSTWPAVVAFLLPKTSLKPGGKASILVVAGSRFS